MKSRITALLLVAAMVSVLLTGCGNKPAETTQAAADSTTAAAADTTAAAAKDAVTIRLTSIWSNDDRTKIIQEYFVDAINNATDGRVVVEYYQGDTLVASNSVVEYMTNGMVDASVADVAVWNVYTHAVDILNANYFDSSAHVQKFLEGPFGEELAGVLSEKAGVKVLAWLHSGDVDIIGNSKRALTTPDYSGLQLRAANSSDAAICSTLGGTPVTIDAAELYTALQRGTVDGFTMTVVSTVLANQLFEECGYFTRLLMKSGVRNPLTIREEIWNSLSAEDQEIVAAAAKETEKQLFDFQQNAVDGYWAQLQEKEGVEVYVVEGDQIQVWQTALEPAYTEVLKDIDATAIEQYKTWIAEAR